MIRLLEHHSTPPAAKFTLTATAERSGNGLNIIYTLNGDIDVIFLPAITQPERVDGLWKTTCFEVFAAPVNQSTYIEYNFAPSLRWAAYRFSSYRENMKNMVLPNIPMIECSDKSSHIRLAASVALPPEWSDSTLMLNLTAVIEEKDGTKSYWALKHPDGPPDFHDPACFILSLKAPDAA